MMLYNYNPDHIFSITTDPAAVTATVSAGQIVWELGDLLPGVSGFFYPVLDASGLAGQTATSTVTISAGAAESNLANNSSTLAVTILPAITPVATVTIAGPVGTTTGVAATFTAEISPTSATEPVSFTWSPAPEAGQGTAQATYRWPSAGSRLVSVTAQNSGGSASDNHQVTVFTPPSAAFDLSPDEGQKPLTVTFDDQSSGPYHTCLWLRRNAATHSDRLATGCQGAQYTFETAGAFDIGLIAAGPGGVSLLIVEDAVTVHEGLGADFSGFPTAGAAPLEVQFTNLTPNVGMSTSCLWDFGDGGANHTCSNQSHAYTTPGVYTVTLIVTGTFESDTEVKPAYIQVYQAPDASFSASPQSGPSPLAVGFTNSSTGHYTSCVWTFGDGASSNVCANPSHTYHEAGVYSVSLVVNGPGGADSMTRTNYITVTAGAHTKLYLPITRR
jgi:PKD repeat protein